MVVRPPVCPGFGVDTDTHKLAACVLSQSRLHFVVPGGSDSSSSSGGGGERMVFPSRREQFLGFAALSEWLLEQLGNGDRVPTTTTGVSSSDAPIAVCANILRGCQVS